MSSDLLRSFWDLHQDGCFVIPNPWDIGSAVYLESLGFKALATTSAGLAFTQGLPDGVRSASLHTTLQNIRDIVSAVSLPVTADFQAGFAENSVELEKNVAACITTGVAGLSIEDATGDETQPLFELDTAMERVRAARKAIDRSGKNVLLTARCETWLVGDNTPLETSIERLRAYSDAGADCLFAPGVTATTEIATLVEAIHPKPLNVGVTSAQSGLTVAILKDLGVRRVSVGAAIARTAWGAVIQTSKEIAEHGTFTSFASATPFQVLNQIFENHSDKR